MGALLVLGLLVRPEAAGAHEAIAGVTGFPAALLHPLVVFDNLSAMFAAGLVAGQKAAARVPLGVAALIGGLLAGAFAPLYEVLPTIVVAMMPLTTAGIAGLMVAAAFGLPLAATLGVLFVLGVAVGANTFADFSAPLAAAQTVGGAAITVAAVVAVLAAVVSQLKWTWARIGVRIAGSWIAASALMVFAFIVSRWSQWAVF